MLDECHPSTKFGEWSYMCSQSRPYYILAFRIRKLCIEWMDVVLSYLEFTTWQPLGSNMFSAHLGISNVLELGLEWWLNALANPTM